MKSKSYFVYIITNQKNGALYIGVTSSLSKRIFEYQNAIHEGFTKRYGLKKLIYYEGYEEPLTAIAREKQMKKWKRAWKIKLIEEHNPDWTDLSVTLNK